MPSVKQDRVRRSRRRARRTGHAVELGRGPLARRASCRLSIGCCLRLNPYSQASAAQATGACLPSVPGPRSSAPASGRSRARPGARRPPARPDACRASGDGDRSERAARQAARPTEPGGPSVPHRPPRRGGWTARTRAAGAPPTCPHPAPAASAPRAPSSRPRRRRRPGTCAAPHQRPSTQAPAPAEATDPPRHEHDPSPRRRPAHARSTVVSSTKTQSPLRDTRNRNQQQVALPDQPTTGRSLPTHHVPPSQRFV